MLFITTLIKGVYRYVKYNPEEQDDQNLQENFVQNFIVRGKFTECNWCFFIQALDAHRLEQSEEISIAFFTNNGTPVNSEELFDFIGQKINCRCFYIELKICGETNKHINATVSESLGLTLNIFLIVVILNS